jgi:hypothetical protein
MGFSGFELESDRIGPPEESGRGDGCTSPWVLLKRGLVSVLNDDELKVAIDPGGQLRLRAGANFLGHHSAIFEQHQRGNAANAVLGWNGRVFIHIELGHFQLALVFAGDLLDNGADHLAWAAPFSPEINKHGQIGLKDIGFKGCVGNGVD